MPRPEAPPPAWSALLNAIIQQQHQQLQQQQLQQLQHQQQLLQQQQQQQQQQQAPRQPQQQQQQQQQLPAPRQEQQQRPLQQQQQRTSHQQQQNGLHQQQQHISNQQHQKNPLQQQQQTPQQQQQQQQQISPQRQQQISQQQLQQTPHRPQPIQQEQLHIPITSCNNNNSYLSTSSNAATFGTLSPVATTVSNTSNPSSDPTWFHHDTYATAFKRLSANRVLLVLDTSEKLLRMLQSPNAVLLVASHCFSMHPQTLKDYNIKNITLDVCSPNPIIIQYESHQMLKVSVYVPAPQQNPKLPETTTIGPLAASNSIANNSFAAPTNLQPLAGGKRRSPSSSHSNLTPAPKIGNFSSGRPVSSTSSHPNQYSQQHVPNLNRTVPSSTASSITTAALPPVPASTEFRLYSQAASSAPSTILSQAMTAAQYPMPSTSLISSPQMFMNAVSNLPQTMPAAIPFPSAVSSGSSIDNTTSSSNESEPKEIEAVTLLEMAREFLRQQQEEENKKFLKSSPTSSTKKSSSSSSATSIPQATESVDIDAEVHIPGLVRSSSANYCCKVENKPMFSGSSTCSPVSAITGGPASPLGTETMSVQVDKQRQTLSSCHIWNHVDIGLNILDRVLFYLPLRDQLTCRQVSSSWCRAIDTSKIWQSLTIRQSFITSWSKASECFHGNKTCQRLHIVLDEISVSTSSSSTLPEKQSSELADFYSFITAVGFNLKMLTIEIQSNSTFMKILWLDELLKPLKKLQNLSIICTQQNNAPQLRVSAFIDSLISTSLHSLTVKGFVNPDFLSIISPQNLPNLVNLNLEIKNELYLEILKKMVPKMIQLKTIEVNLNLDTPIDGQSFHWLPYLKKLQSLSIFGLNFSTQTTSLFKAISSCSTINNLFIQQLLPKQLLACHMQIIHMLPKSLENLNWIIDIINSENLPIIKSDIAMHFFNEKWFENQIKSHFEQFHSKTINLNVTISQVID